MAGWALDTARVKAIIDARETGLSDTETLTAKYSEAEATIRQALEERGYNPDYITSDDTGLDRAAAYLVMALVYEDVMDEAAGRRAEIYEGKASRYATQYQQAMRTAQFDYDADQSGAVSEGEEDARPGQAAVIL